MSTTKRSIKQNKSSFSKFYLFIYYLFLLFSTAPVACGGSQARGSNQSYCCWSMPEPQQHQIQALSVTYTTAQGNARSLTHWVRTRIKPATSWFLVGSIYAVPQWPRALFFNYPKMKILYIWVPCAAALLHSLIPRWACLINQKGLLCT